MIFKQYQFKPSFLMTLITALIFPCLVSLGIWQLHRAEDKQFVLDKFAENQSAATQPFADVASHDIKQLQYATLSLTGHALNESTFLLDNKFYNHQLGFHVITPFLDAATDSIVLVDRGFTPVRDNRLNAVSVPPLTTETLEVRVQALNSNNITLSDTPEFTANQLPIQQKIDWVNIEKASDKPLNNFLGLLQSPQGEFVQAWAPSSVILPERHRGYAFQWFALATTLICLYLITNTKRISRPE